MIRTQSISPDDRAAAYALACDMPYIEALKFLRDELDTYLADAISIVQNLARTYPDSNLGQTYRASGRV
jgi:hypothetical protein